MNRTARPTKAQHRDLTAAAQLVHDGKPGTVTARADVLRRMQAAGWVDTRGYITPDGLAAIGHEYADRFEQPAPVPPPAAPINTDALTRPFPADGSPLQLDAGLSCRVLLIPTIDAGFVLRVLAGTTEEWSESFTSERDARETMHGIKGALDRRCVSIWQIAQDRRNAALHRDRVLSATELVVNQAVEQVTARTVEEIEQALKADVDKRRAAELAIHDETVAVVQEIVGDGQGWTRMRQAFRPVRDTKTQVFRRDLTAAQQRALAAEVDGKVHPGGGVRKDTLEALADKGAGRLIRGGPGRRPFEIAYLDVTVEAAA